MRHELQMGFAFFAIGFEPADVCLHVFMAAGLWVCLFGCLWLGPADAAFGAPTPSAGPAARDASRLREEAAPRRHALRVLNGLLSLVASSAFFRLDGGSCWSGWEYAQVVSVDAAAWCSMGIFSFLGFAAVEIALVAWSRDGQNLLTSSRARLLAATACACLGAFHTGWQASGGLLLGEVGPGLLSLADLLEHRGVASPLLPPSRLVAPVFPVAASVHYLASLAGAEWCEADATSAAKDGPAHLEGGTRSGLLTAAAAILLITALNDAVLTWLGSHSRGQVSPASRLGLSSGKSKEFSTIAPGADDANHDGPDD